MSSLNKVMIIGNLGANPDYKSLQDNAVCNFTVATSYHYKTKVGEKKEETEWHRVSAFGKLADVSSKYLSKGSKVYVEGRIKTSKYQKDGIDRYSVGIVASTITFLSEKSAASSSKEYAAKSQSYGVASKANDLDDDVPF